MSIPLHSQFGPTQKDIADVLGVSQSTVALALNEKHRHKLLPETVTLILAKAEELGYRPQRFARILRKGRSHTIGTVYGSGIYYAPLERAKFLARSAIKAGYQLVAADLEWFGGDIVAAQDYLLGSAVEGVVLCNIQEMIASSWLHFLRERSIPVVSLSSNIPDHVDQVYADMEEAYAEATRHHLALGSRKLTLLLPYWDGRELMDPNSSTVRRALGFCKVLEEVRGTLVAGEMTRKVLGVPDHLREGTSEITAEIIYPERTDKLWDVFDYGCYWTEQKIASSTLPDSVICTNDEVAAGVLSVCLRKGIPVPGKLKISGADNASFSRLCGIPLTTVRQPSCEMAEWAIRRIVELIENPEERKHPQRRHFPCEIIVRQSTVAVE